MLTFRNTNIFFIFLLSFLVAIHDRANLSFYWYWVWLTAYFLIVFWGCYFIASGFFIPIVCKGDAGKKEISISFDDGPAQSYTPEILQVLKNENVKAAFFCIGSRIAGNEAILRQVHHDGHIIGNHSYSHHFWFDMYSAKKMQDDLQLMDQATEQVTGLKPRLFRPPYGVTNPNVKKAIIKGGYTPVGWSVRSMDTVIKDRDKLLRKINKGIEPGAIFLFHDTSKTTLDVLPAFIQEVKKRGFNIVPLDKLLALQPYA